MSAKRSIGNAEYLKRRIPQNPRYQHVKSRLDTGCSLTKYLDRLEEMKRNYRYRRGELFRRLKVSTFAQLVIQVASVSDDEINGETQNLNDIPTVSPEAHGDHLPEDHLSEDPYSCLPTTPVQFDDNSVDVDVELSPRSTLQSVISGVGELDLDGERCVKLAAVCGPQSWESPYADCPYLLLDVRDRDEYDQCHVISAHSYPVATLSRTMNPYIKEVLDYKNALGKIIILYDEDERIASQAATTMCERGFENLFMLSGGLKVLAQKFPEGMTTGTIPVRCLPSPSNAGQPRHCSSRPVEKAPHPAEKKWRFTHEDLSKIQIQLEEMLISTDNSSRLSRMSVSRAESQTSSARFRKTPSVTGSESARSQSSRPWK
ncbi:centrosomal protein of 41 kDa isoform X1 [Brienomyrus brachyistius]|uniref:centrosomal protein of 41 kDa isoform X1 n=1 Tax=Brienomyrus brachyistius TaxID=42636 RepID=UPI0020B19FFF|nr:centrosomal protein of 41 kDa isoform X1 [Brienomyrus brachyistius]